MHNLKHHQHIISKSNLFNIIHEIFHLIFFNVKYSHPGLFILCYSLSFLGVIILHFIISTYCCLLLIMITHLNLYH
jgi:hypothetical protein